MNPEPSYKAKLKPLGQTPVRTTPTANPTGLNATTSEPSYKAKLKPLGYKVDLKTGQRITPETKPVKEPLKERVATTLLSGADEVAAQQERFKSGKQGAIRTGFQTLGTGLGTAAEVGFETARSIPVLGKGIDIATQKLGEGIQKTLDDPDLIWGKLAKKYEGLDEGTKADLKAVIEVGSTLLGGKIAEQGVKTGLRKVAERGVAKEAASAISNTERALELTQPKLTKQQRIDVLKRTGRPGGATPGESKFGPTVERASTNHDVEIADSVAPYMAKKKALGGEDVIGTLENIQKGVDDITDNQILPLLRKYASPFNEAQFDSYIRKIEKPDFIASDATLSNYYDLFRNRALNLVKGKKHNMEGVYRARQELDRIFTEQKGQLSGPGDKMSALEQAYRDTRRAMNDFVAENTKGADANFKELLRKQSNLLEGKERIAIQNQDLLTTGRLEKIKRDNPNLYKTLRFILYGGTILGAAKGLTD